MLRSSRVEGLAEVSARAAGLVYVTDLQPGIRRVPSGKGFRYVTKNGTTIRDPRVLGKIKRLAIPPAWSGVWICPLENGHLQATGRDARGRKQYRYHPYWRQVRDETKYARMIEFGRALPRMRRRVHHDMRLEGLPRAKVLATVVKLLEVGFIRVGNDEYSRLNHSYGLTTLQDRHVQVNGMRIRFRFRGKGGKLHDLVLEDQHLARIVRRCQALPGQELFQYSDADGRERDITSTDVNDYLREISGKDFTAKDFRTWAGTVLAAMALEEFEKVDSKATAKSNIRKAIERVAQKLGNTPAICRKCYVHPAVLETYLDRGVLGVFQTRARQQLAQGIRGLQPEEAAVLALLEKRLATEQKRTRPTLLGQLKASLTHRQRGRKS